MKNIVASNEEVVDVISRIAAATGEQANSIDQINHAITQMENTTQHNAAIVEETAATAETMRAQAQALQALVERFKLSAAGDAAATVTAITNTQRPLLPRAMLPRR
jgi:methyl-accepting chemotaxis protein